MEYELIHENNSIILVDEDEMTIGSLTYKIEEDLIHANTTNVDKEHSGKGYAKKLVDELVEKARNENKKIVANCSYIQRLFEKDDSYLDVYYKG